MPSTDDLPEDQETTTCYICLNTDGTNGLLVSPCTQCTALAHQSCINEQVRKGIDTCGMCNNQLKYDSNRKFQYDCRCCTFDELKYCLPSKKSTLIILYMLLQSVGYALLVLGKTITADLVVSLTFFFVSLCLMFIFVTQIEACLRRNCEYDNSEGNYWSKSKQIITRLLAIVFMTSSIMFIHMIGYFFNLLMGWDDEFFTLMPFISGCVIIMATILLIMLIGLSCVCIRIMWYECYKSCSVQEVNVECREAEVDF